LFLILFSLHWHKGWGASVVSQKLIILESMLGQKGLKTYKRHRRTIPKRKMEIYCTNCNTKLMNFLKMQRNNPKHDINNNHLSICIWFGHDCCTCLSLGLVRNLKKKKMHKKLWWMSAWTGLPSCETLICGEVTPPLIEVTQPIVLNLEDIADEQAQGSPFCSKELEPNLLSS